MLEAVEQSETLNIAEYVGGGAGTYALEYLRKHPEITSESVPWHIHSNLETSHAGRGDGSGQ